MSNGKEHIKRNITWWTAFVYLAFAVVLGRLYYISLVQGEEFRNKSEEQIVQRREIPAKRGDIYSADGKVLATTKPVYEVFFDPVTVDDEVFNVHVQGLSRGLATINPSKGAAEWEQYLREQRMQGRRYVPLAKKLSYSQLQAMKDLPILNRGKFRGGIIVLENLQRIQMATGMNMRTIGYDKKAASAGLEGYFSAYLQGKPGNRLMQKIAGNDWRPLEDPEAIAPVDGYDLYTTIDTRIQDVAQQSLLAALEKFEADHGCAVVMEVSTGNVIAMANLGKTESGTYAELRNYAVWERTEPGSTFKLLSTMVAIEEGGLDTGKVVDTRNGTIEIYGKKVRDSNKKGYGKISLARAFEVSSNTGIVTAVYDRFKEQPEDFTDALYRMGIHQQTGVAIKGESKPYIPTPADPKWSGTTLPWMAYGYNVSLTPLQMLTIYNAIANNGTMVKPQVVARIGDHARTVEAFEAEVLNPAICSQKTLGQIQQLLKDAVKRGTATNIYNEDRPIAGKTGTCQLNYWIEGSKDYQSSFAGYFPADNPKYSCIVVVNKPNYYKGYYGNIVAGPVFQSIANEVYSQLPLEQFEVGPDQLDTEMWRAKDAEGLASKMQAIQKNYLPSLHGLTAREALEVIQKAGLTAQLDGVGVVTAQEPSIGTALSQCSTVKLTLK